VLAQGNTCFAWADVNDVAWQIMDCLQLFLNKGPPKRSKLFHFGQSRCAVRGVWPPKNPDKSPWETENAIGYTLKVDIYSGGCATFFRSGKEKRWFVYPRQWEAGLRLSILQTSVLTRYRAPIGFE